ncbi:MAG: hypothetical protein ACM3X7_07720 [Solirubrobacterales bacterium]
MINNVVEELIQVIEALEGEKIITLMDDDKNSWQFNFSKNGKIGEDESHEKMLRTKLSETLTSKGSIIIRQSTDIKKAGIPVKKMYGIYLHNNDWTPIAISDMELSYGTSTGSGEVIFATLHKG